MASDVSRAVTSAVQWTIVGIAIGVLPTYVLVQERAKKGERLRCCGCCELGGCRQFTPHGAPRPQPSCPAPPITLATVVAVTGNGAPHAASPTRPTQVPAEKNDDDEMKTR